jgi:quercetin dioxygenase-like cupin family protein
MNNRFVPSIAARIERALAILLKATSLARLSLAAVFLMSIAVSSSQAWAFTFTPFGFGTLPDGEIVEMYQVEFAPGEPFPWHFHPGTVDVVITQGSLTEYRGCGQDPETHNAGDAFEEEPGEVHRVTNNGDEPTDLLVSGVLPDCGGLISGYQDLFLAGDNGPQCAGKSGHAKKAKHSCKWLSAHCTFDSSLGAFTCNQ